MATYDCLGSSWENVKSEENKKEKLFFSNRTPGPQFFGGNMGPLRCWIPQVNFCFITIPHLLHTYANILIYLENIDTVLTV